MKLSMGYPSMEEEVQILERTELNNPIVNIEEPVMHVEDIIAMQQEVKQVRVSDAVKEYIVDIVAATRADRNTVLELTLLGASPRGSIALFKAAKAYAYIYERDYVTPDDVKNTAVSVLSHRIILSPQGKTAFGSGEAYVENVLKNCPVPAMS